MKTSTFSCIAIMSGDASLLSSNATTAPAQGEGPAVAAPPICSEVGFGLFQRRCETLASGGC
jgi:hypothetical protein